MAPSGGLTVTNAVAGSAGEQDREWNFTVTLSDTAVNGTYGGMTFVNGVATFALRGGESVTATGLPAGTLYAVSEAEADSDGYRTTSTNATGLIPDSGVITAAFVNHLEEETAANPDVPLTGDTSRTGLWALLCGLSLAGLFLLRKSKGFRGEN